MNSADVYRTIHVNTGSAYDVHIGHGIIDNAGELIRNISKASKAAVITDSNVFELYADRLTDSLKKSGFDCCVFTFKADEESKSLETLSEIYSFLIKNEITRSDIIIALGGGVVGDTAGFAAATYLRGIDYVQIPTTFLAQIDSSVGGKTAVNIPDGKNLVGAFKQPKTVICDIDTLSTLSEDIFSDGAAEAIKYGVIRDKALLEMITHDVYKNLNEIIYRCIDIKRAVVENDEFDTGERMILNFGHTIGHAIEKHSHHKISHGKAVAIGMVMMTRACVNAGISKEETLNDIVNACKALSLKTEYDCPVDELIPYMLSDKKRTSDTINIIASPNTGSAVIVKKDVHTLSDFLNCKENR